MYGRYAIQTAIDRPRAAHERRAFFERRAIQNGAPNHSQMNGVWLSVTHRGYRARFGSTYASANMSDAFPSPDAKGEPYRTSWIHPRRTTPGVTAATKARARRKRPEVLTATERPATMTASGARLGLMRIPSDENIPDQPDPDVDPRDATSSAASQQAAQ